MGERKAGKPIYHTKSPYAPNHIPKLEQPHLDTVFNLLLKYVEGVSDDQN